MSWVTAGHETKSEVGFCIDVGSFIIMNWVTAGHEIESEVELCIGMGSFLMN